MSTVKRQVEHTQLFVYLQLAMADAVEVNCETHYFGMFIP